MRQRKFPLQPLLDLRTHRENTRRVELAQAQRARDAAAERFTEFERRCDDAGAALVRCASEGRTGAAQSYDAMLSDAGGLRLRRGVELRAHEAAVEAATAALRVANRERRTLERLRERLEARRARRRNGDD